MRSWAAPFGVLIGVAAASTVFAQSTLDWPIGEMFPVGIDTGPIDNPSDQPALIFQQDVSWPAAAWLRLYFDSPNLPNGGYVRVVSALDGQMQQLDADGLEMWSNSTAYFNGDSVLLQVVAGPRTPPTASSSANWRPSSPAKAASPHPAGSAAPTTASIPTPIGPAV